MEVQVLLIKDCCFAILLENARTTGKGYLKSRGVFWYLDREFTAIHCHFRYLFSLGKSAS